MKTRIYSLSVCIFIILIAIPNIGAAQNNIAPQATITAAGTGGPACGGGPCSTLNDLDLGICGTQQMWISTDNPPSSTPGDDYIQFDFTAPKPITEIIIHHANNSPARFLHGALIQKWNGVSWINHHAFSNLPLSCNNSITFPILITDRFRLTSFQMNGPGQTRNPNFREIEVISGSSGTNDAIAISIDSLNAFCAGTQDVYATIGNYGINQIDSLDIKWEVDGVAQSIVHYNQLLDTLNGNLPYSASVYLGNVTFNSGSTNIKVYTSLPNGAVDTINLNDTINVDVQTTTPPTDLIAYNATTTSMDFEVYGLAGTVDYEYGLAGFTPGTGTIGSSTSNPFNISSLQSSTNYDIYIRSNCGGSDNKHLGRTI